MMNNANPEKIEKGIDLDELDWAVKSRTQNQLSCVRLLRLFEENKSVWTTKIYSRAAQDLLAVSFSLWRSAFLADKKSSRSAVFADACKFLNVLVETNNIGFAQDRASKEWSFNYYVRNARYHLQTLAEYWKDAVPAYEGRTRTAKEHWKYCQKLLDAALNTFEADLIDKRKEKAAAISARNVKEEARERRRKSRATKIGRQA